MSELFGVQAVLDDWNWSRSQQRLDGGAEAGVCSLSSSSTDFVCAASDLQK